MKIEDRLADLDLKHRKAFAVINKHLNDPDKDVRKLVRWLAETDANPYTILHENWAKAYDSAENFAALCRHIHHALVDDGDIEFVTVDGEPRIVFTRFDEPDFRNIALNDIEKEFEKTGRYDGSPIHYDIQRLSGVDAFIEERARYEQEYRDIMTEENG
jgi:hypothetical protein